MLISLGNENFNIKANESVILWYFSIHCDNDAVNDDGEWMVHEYCSVDREIRTSCTH